MTASLLNLSFSGRCHHRMQALQSQGIIRYNMIAAGIMNIGTVALCALLSQDSVLGFEGVTRDRTSPPLWRGSFFVALYHPDFAHRYPFFFCCCWSFSSSIHCFCVAFNNDMQCTCFAAGLGSYRVGRAIVHHSKNQPRPRLVSNKEANYRA